MRIREEPVSFQTLLRFDFYRCRLVKDFLIRYFIASGIQIAFIEAVSSNRRGMKKGILSTLVLVFIITAHSQRYIWSPDSISLADPNYAMDRYHDILRYHDPIMYLAYPVIRPIIKRKLPLEDGKGKKGFWLQALISATALSFTRASIIRIPFFSVCDSLLMRAWQAGLQKMIPIHCFPLIISLDLALISFSPDLAL